MAIYDKVIDVALDQVGYLEKRSNKDLDSKTANAGSGNYTKYNRDLKAWTGVGYINQQWCQAFVDWCFIAAYGLEKAKKLIYVWTNYTPTGSDAFKKRGRYIKRGKGTPKRGDVIYFYSKSKGRIGHVGIVYKVSGSKVYTIEGNTSGASSLITNGGGVRKKSYNMSSTYIDGYGSVDYSVLSDDPPKDYKLGERDLKKGDKGPDVKELQEDLKSLGYDFPKYGCDGDFGAETETNVKGFQRVSGLEPTGVFDHKSYEAMLSVMGGYVLITGNSVNVRSGPSKECKSLGVVHKGDKLPFGGLVNEENGWYMVDYQLANGWVSPKYSELVEQHE